MLAILIFCVVGLSNGDYLSERQTIIENEKNLRTGAAINLNENELKVNEILLKQRQAEYDDGFNNPEKFLPAMHFFEARKTIEQSPVFQMIKKIPKGSFLHGHDSALASVDYVYNVTFTENLYGCTVDDRLQLRFFTTPDLTCQWTLVSDLRKQNGFDDFLQTQISMLKFDPDTTYTDINKAWKYFIATFGTVEGMIYHVPIFKEYLYQVLQEFYDDNLQFAEIRATLTPLYELDGKTLSYIETAEVYDTVIAAFKRDHPDFIGAKLIYAPLRHVGIETLTIYLETLREIKATFPNLIIGFDLVGQEDLGTPLLAFVGELENLEIDVYYHAGETNWYGSATDKNLIDAVLLGTKRIGHGFALIKHPEVLNMVKEKNIAIEISPISNQVLKLIEDQRNHPAVYYLANNYPVVISADDPGFWGAIGVSYDWYMAFMGFGSYDSDLKLLKQLAINSITYSSLSSTEKTEAMNLWQTKWDDFIAGML